MRLELVPTRPEEWLARWLDLAPGAIGCAFYGMMAARTLMAAERLGVYAALAGGGRGAEEIAAARSLSVRGARALLDALVGLGVARRRGARYALSRSGARWLAPDAPGAMGAFLRFNYAQWEWWSQLEAAVRSGEAVGIHRAAADDPLWEDYVGAMLALARIAAPEVARRVPVPPRATAVLDLGGAHGWYAAELCRRHPALRATVLDLEGAVEIGRPVIAAAGLAGRVRHRVADVRTDPLGGPADVALVFQLLHHLEEDARDALLRRVHAALAPGGTVALLEPVRDPARAARDASPLVHLHYFLTSRAGALTRDELTSALARTGFRSVRAHRVRRLPVELLVTGRRR